MKFIKPAKRLALLAPDMVQTLLAVVSYSILSKVMPLSEYGIFRSILAYCPILISISPLGLYGTLVSYYIRNKKKASAEAFFNNLFFAWFILLAPIAAGFSVIFAYQIATTHFAAIGIALVLFFLYLESILLTIADANCLSKEKYGSIALLYSINGITRILLIVGMYFTYDHYLGLKNVIAAYLGGAMLSIFYSINIQVIKPAQVEQFPACLIKYLRLRNIVSIVRNISGSLNSSVLTPLLTFSIDTSISSIPFAIIAYHLPSEIFAKWANLLMVVKFTLIPATSYVSRVILSIPGNSSSPDEKLSVIHKIPNLKVKKTIISLSLVIVTSFFASTLITPYAVAWLDSGIFGWQLLLGISNRLNYYILILLLTLYLLGTSVTRSIFMRPSLASHGLLPVLAPQLSYLCFIYTFRNDLTIRTIASGLVLAIVIQYIICFCWTFASFRPSLLKFNETNSLR